ncbi:MAG: hypothetical protein ACFFDT_21325 [Candidatus Hodarchaeota archaeon]
MKRPYKKNMGKAIEEFNRYRSPEATARLISIDEKSFTIEFTGPFCATCGFYDYFDDLRIILEKFSLKSKIREIQEIDKGAIIKLRME